MISYDNNGDSIVQFSKRYNEFKAVFSLFKDSIKSKFIENNEFSITVKGETETGITLIFIDRVFLAELSMFRRDERSLLGKITFSEIIVNKEEEKIEIDQAFIDSNGNVKETPTSQFSDLNLKQEESSTYLLKCWFVKFIENNIEKYKPA